MPVCLSVGPCVRMSALPVCCSWVSGISPCRHYPGRAEARVQQRAHPPARPADGQRVVRDPGLPCSQPGTGEVHQTQVGKKNSTLVTHLHVVSELYDS